MTATVSNAQTNSRLAVVFPGQGTELAGIGRELIQNYPSAKKKLAEMSTVIDRDLEALICGQIIAQDTLAIHQAMVSFGIVAFDWLTQARGYQPALVAGHSLGEITALACAGAVSPGDAIAIADARGRFIAEACQQKAGGMMAFTGAPLQEMEQTIRSWIESEGFAEKLWIVNYNGPQQLVVAGDLDALAALQHGLQSQTFSSIPLPTAGAFHTPFMRPAAQKMAKFLQNIAFHAPRVPVVSSTTGKVLTRHQSLSVHLAFQIVKPVKWLAVMDFMRAAQIHSLMEIGSGNGVLTKLAIGFQRWQVKPDQVANLLTKFQKETVGEG